MSVVVDVAGKTVLDLLWERLDAFVDDLQESLADQQDGPAQTQRLDQAIEMRGRAYGMAEAIALVTNPYHPDVDAVRGEAMERWEQRNQVVEPVRKRNERSTSEHLSELEERRARRRARREARNG